MEITNQDWNCLAALGHGLLELLRVLTHWPVVLAALVLWLANSFRNEIQWLMRNSKISVESAGMKVQSEPMQLPPVTPPEPPSGSHVNRDSVESHLDAASEALVSVARFSLDEPAAKNGDGTAVIESLQNTIATLEVDRDALREQAWWNQCQYLEAFFVPKTKALLYWIASLLGGIQETVFDQEIAVRFLDEEGKTTKQALISTEVIVFADGFVRLTAKGRAYIEWRESSQLPEPPSIFTFPAIESPVPRINRGEYWEVAYWAKELGVTPKEVLAAVDSVGNHVGVVRAYLEARKAR